MAEEEETMSTSEEEDNSEDKDVYIPGEDLKNGEELVHDESTYKVFHQAQTGAPCLSFDILMDDLGDNRTSYPETVFIVAGTNSDQGRANHVIVMKMGNLHSVKQTSSDDELSDKNDSDEEEEEGEKPTMQAALGLHRGCVNRIRSTKIGDKQLAATWSERRAVHLWDLSKQLEGVQSPQNLQTFLKNHQKKLLPLYTFTGHMDEGFSMDWSPTQPGYLLTGDCKSNIHLWNPRQDATWHVDQRPFAAHTDSVEDIQWSPNEKTVFMSCSADKTVKVWDIRAKPASACMLSVEAHESDVNVINWNKFEPFAVSGGDDAMIKVWDLRKFKDGKPIASFKHHTKAITSVEWHSSDSSVFAASSADNQVTQWDLAVEPVSVNEKKLEPKLKDIPPQLLFIHQGQTDVKEVHWHPQIPGLIISTAQSGLNVFKTVSV